MFGQEANLALMLVQVNPVGRLGLIPDNFAPPSDFGIHTDAIFNSRFAFDPHSS